MTAQKLRRKIRRTAVRFLTVARDMYITRMSVLSDKVQSHAIQPIGFCSVPKMYSFCGSREDRIGLVVREGADRGGGSVRGGVCQDLTPKGWKKYPVRKLARRNQRVDAEEEERLLDYVV